MSSAHSDGQLIVAGCAECNDGYGEIFFYELKWGELVPYSIRGDPATGKRVGKAVWSEQDPISGGNRIWYTTDYQVISASLITYGGKVVLEDELFI